MAAGGGTQLASGTYPIRSFCNLHFVFSHFSLFHIFIPSIPHQLNQLCTFTPSPSPPFSRQPKGLNFPDGK